MSTSRKRPSASARKRLESRLAAADSGAIFSEDRRHRYLLWRRVGEGVRTALFIGLNPSTADERRNDPTIRRCISFAAENGAGRLLMSNLYACRATRPDDLFLSEDPVGPGTDMWLGAARELADFTVACWGAEKRAVARAEVVGSGFVQALCLGWTASGAPRHPLYVRAGTPLVPLHRERTMSVPIEIRGEDERRDA